MGGILLYTRKEVTDKKKGHNQPDGLYASLLPERSADLVRESVVSGYPKRSNSCKSEEESQTASQDNPKYPSKDEDFNTLMKRHKKTLKLLSE